MRDFERRGVKELGLLARARRGNVDGGKEAAVSQAAIKNEFHIPRTLELLGNHVIHAAAGIDKGSGEDGQRASPFQLSGCAKEALGHLQCIGVHPATQGAPGLRVQVMRAGQAGERIQYDDYILAGKGIGHGAVEAGRGYGQVLFQGAVIRGRKDLGLDRAAKICDFLGPLVNQQTVEDRLGRTSSNAMTQVF